MNLPHDFMCILFLGTVDYYRSVKQFMNLFSGVILRKRRSCVKGNMPVRHSITAFLKLWSADHKWSSGAALVVLLD